jgi:hypothetical protein
VVKPKVKVLVACEFSGAVRDAFIKGGHEAMSCDLLPNENPGPHYQGDIFDVVDDNWDLMIAFPPCTYLTLTGNKWFKPEFADRFPTRHKDRKDGIDFFMKLANLPIPKIAIENPIGIMSSHYRKPDQIIQPYQYGFPTTKATCLWLKGLPLLQPTNIVSKGEVVISKSGNRMSKWYYETSKLTLKGGIRAKARSVTFPGIAIAMADQWGTEKVNNNIQMELI